MPITQAILPVAGLGTRFLPWTKIVAKELLPIGNTPIIGLLVDECLSVGVTDICFVISHGKETILKYFEKDAALDAVLAAKGKSALLDDLKKYDNVRFTSVYQEQQLGDGHAILQAKDWVTTESIAVLFGDDLIVGKENGLQQLARAAKDAPANAAILALENVPKERVSSYGIVSIDDSKTNGRLKTVTGLVEKPKPEEAPSTLGIVGKYIIPKEVIDVLPDTKSGKDGEIRLIDALIGRLGQTPIHGYEFEGTRYDTGNPKGYKEAVVALG